MSRSRNTDPRRTTGCPNGRGCCACRDDLQIAHRKKRADESFEADLLEFYEGWWRKRLDLDELEDQCMTRQLFKANPDAQFAMISCPCRLCSPYC